MTELQEEIPSVIHIFHNKDFLENRLRYPHTEHAMNSWRRHLPDCQLRLWHDELPEFQEMLTFSRYLRESYRYRLWPVVSDYVRAWALYRYGGIYLDTDMSVIRRCDFLRQHDFFVFSAEFESHRLPDYIQAASLPDINVEPAFIGAQAGHPILQEVLNIYNGEEMFQSRVWIANSIYTAALLRVAQVTDPQLIPTGHYTKKGLALSNGRAADVRNDLSAGICLSSEVLSQSHVHENPTAGYTIYSPASLIQCNQNSEDKAGQDNCYAWHSCNHAWGNFRSAAFARYKHWPRPLFKIMMSLAICAEKIYNLLRICKKTFLARSKRRS